MNASGYDPKLADGGQEGLRGIALWSPDVVVLDFGLPDMDGQDVLMRAGEFYKGPIIILSARDKEAEKIEAFEAARTTMWKSRSASADRWPASEPACARRPIPPCIEGPIFAGDIVIDLDRWLVTFHGETVRLTPRNTTCSDISRGMPASWSVTRTCPPPSGAHRMSLTPSFFKSSSASSSTNWKRTPAQPSLILTEPGVGYQLQA